MLEILPYSDQFGPGVRDLIFNILETEFNSHETDYDRSDLYKISDIYQGSKSNFWVALDRGDVVGTAALQDYGGARGYLKRFYVKKENRGTGLAQKILKTALDYARANSFKEIFLGTVPAMIAANKFYQKEGFERIGKLPADMPDFGDTIFYRMIL